MKIRTVTNLPVGYNSLLTIDEQITISPFNLAKSEKSIMITCSSFWVSAELVAKEAFNQLKKFHPKTKATMRGNTIVIPKDEIESFTENGRVKSIEGSDGKLMTVTVEGDDRENNVSTVRIGGKNYFTLVCFKETKKNVRLRCYGLLGNPIDAATEGIEKLRKDFPETNARREGSTVVIPKTEIKSIDRE